MARNFLVAFKQQAHHRDSVFIRSDAFRCKMGNARFGMDVVDIFRDSNLWWNDEKKSNALADMPKPLKRD